MTEYILNSKRESFDPAYLEDRYRTVLVEKLREKQAKALPQRATPATPSARNVINLMEALKRSLAEQKPPAASRTRTSAPKQVTAASNPAGKKAKARSSGRGQSVRARSDTPKRESR